MFPKPDSRSRVKARRHRREVAVIAEVREKVSRRDGDCRLRSADQAVRGAIEDLFGPCGGAPQWAHLGENRRWKTRGQAPEARHTTAGTAMLCDAHHDSYDAHQYDIVPVTSQGADGPLRFTTPLGEYYQEPEC